MSTTTKATILVALGVVDIDKDLRTASEVNDGGLDFKYRNMFVFVSLHITSQLDSKSPKVQLNSSAEQLTQFQQKLRQVGLDLFSVVQTTISSGVC